MVYIDNLVIAFERVLSKFPELQIADSKKPLIESLERRKYDLQDQGIIEAIFEDGEKTLENSFYENIGTYLKDLDTNLDRKDHLNTKEGITDIIEIFISDLEQMIDYYYNALINKHFS